MVYGIISVVAEAQIFLKQALYYFEIVDMRYLSISLSLISFDFSNLPFKLGRKRLLCFDYLGNLGRQSNKQNGSRAEWVQVHKN